MHKYGNIQIYKYTNAQISKYTNTKYNGASWCTILRDEIGKYASHARPRQQPQLEEMPPRPPGLARWPVQETPLWVIFCHFCCIAMIIDQPGILIIYCQGEWSGIGGMHLPLCNERMFRLQICTESCRNSALAVFSDHNISKVLRAC